MKDVLWEEGRERRFMALGELLSCFIFILMSMCQSSCGFCIYRRREYGSGYPSGYSGSVSDEGFPYYFWPVIFPLPCQPKYKPIYPKTQYVVRSLVSASSSTQRTHTNYTFPAILSFHNSTAGQPPPVQAELRLKHPSFRTPPNPYSSGSWATKPPLVLSSHSSVPTAP